MKANESILEHKKTRRRESQEIRKIEILNASIELSIKIGYQQITREAVAAEAKTSCGLVTFYFKNMEELKNEIIETAIDREILPLLAQALSLGGTQTKNLNKKLKDKVLKYLNTS